MLWPPRFPRYEAAFGPSGPERPRLQGLGVLGGQRPSAGCRCPSQHVCFSGWQAAPADMRYSTPAFSLLSRVHIPILKASCFFFFFFLLLITALAQNSASFSWPLTFQQAQGSPVQQWLRAAPRLGTEADGRLQLALFESLLPEHPKPCREAAVKRSASARRCPPAALAARQGAPLSRGCERRRRAVGGAFPVVPGVSGTGRTLGAF